MSYNKERAKGWQRCRVADMNADQKAAYNEHLDKQRERRRKNAKEAADEAKVESNEFAKAAQQAMKRFPMPFEQHFTQEIANRILIWITCAGDLQDVCKERGVPDYPVVMQWIRPYLPVPVDMDEELKSQLEYFRVCYVEARKNKLEKELDDIIRISDTATNKENSAAAKVRVQARVTMLERINVQLFAPTTKSVDDNEDKTPLSEQIADAFEEVAARRRKRLELEESTNVLDVQALRVDETPKLGGGVDVIPRSTDSVTARRHQTAEQDDKR